MINYCSIGVDARVILGLNKKKSESYLFNCMSLNYERSKK